MSSGYVPSSLIQSAFLLCSRLGFIRIKEANGMAVVRGTWCRGERAF